MIIELFLQIFLAPFIRFLVNLANQKWLRQKDILWKKWQNTKQLSLRGL